MFSMEINITLAMKKLRKLAIDHQTPLIRIDFENEVSFVYLEWKDGHKIDGIYTYKDFDTAIKKELERLA